MMAEKKKRKIKTGKISFRYEVLEGHIEILIKTSRQKVFRPLEYPWRLYEAAEKNREYLENKSFLFVKGDKIYPKDKAMLKWFSENKYFEKEFMNELAQSFLKKMQKEGITHFKDEGHEKTVNGYQPVFVEYRGKFFIKDFKIYKRTNFFTFEGNDSQLFEFGKKEHEFIENFYKQFKQLPDSNFFLHGNNPEKLGRWIKREKAKYATEIDEIGNLEALFDYMSDELVHISFGMKTSFIEKDKKFYYKQFNTELYQKIFSIFSEMPYETAGRKRIYLKADFETALQIFNQMDEHKNGIDFFMNEDMVEKIRGKAKIKFTMFSNNELGVPSFDMENINLNREEQVKLLERMRKGEIEKKDGKRYVRLIGDKMIEIENSVNEILQIEDELSNYDTIRPDGTMTKAEKARFAMSDINFNNDEVLKEREIINSFFEIEPAEPVDVNATLFSYQKKGFAWLYELFSNGYGGILGDDMGLGKTLQVISFIKKILIENPERKILIVAPTTLVNNWREEFEKFTDIVPHFIYNMSPKQLKEFIKTYKGGSMITSYEKAANNIDILKDLELDVTFLDEAQKIKNPSSGNKRKLKMLNSRVKFAMTGTPIENSVMDLWSIFDFVFEGYLYSNRKFREEYGNIYIDENSQVDWEDTEAVSDYEESVIQAELKQKSLIRRIKPFILRRRKDEELSHILKEKKVTEHYIELSPIEKLLYTELAEEYKEQLEEEKALIGKNGVDADGDLEDGNEEKQNRKDNGAGMKIFTLIQKLKALTSLQGRMQDLEGNFVEPTKSKEFKKLLIERIKKGDRILVFSSFLEVLDDAGEFLEKNGIKHFRIDGALPASERQKITREFNGNDEYKVVLISLKAGAAGLNLVGANVVIHYDLWWNPSIENQANDRAYRIGQEKNVEIIKLVCNGTIEERILKLQKKKQDLFDIIIEGTKGSPAGMTTAKDLEELIM
jgi:superfamily II DNA/RNA helicase, SNF2 family